jgi:hypothetical protein
MIETGNHLRLFPFIGGCLSFDFSCFRKKGVGGITPYQFDADNFITRFILIPPVPMQSDYVILFLVIIIAFYIIVRIGSLRRWIALNIEMRKGSERMHSGESYRSYAMERKRALSTQQHRLALKKARAGKPRIKS